MKRVAVTGLGVAAPGGSGPVEFFASLVAGRSAVRPLTGPDSTRLKTRIAAEVSLEPHEHFSALRLRMLDRVSQLALCAAAQAVHSARLSLTDSQRLNAGVFFGTSMGGASATEQGYSTLYRDNSDRIKPYTVLKAMNNAPASWIAIDYGLGGPNITYSTACSSSAVAIGEAWLRIRAGTDTLLLAGGAEAPLTLGSMKAWEALQTLATEDPYDSGASCKPFAQDRTGLVLGEGAAVLVLEEWDSAIERGAHIYGEIVGYGLSTDMAHITRPTVEGQARAMRLALDAAALGPGAIDYINAHGTGTVANDVVETAAIRDVFGPHADKLAVSSTKSMHGHLLGAAGAVETLVTLLAIGQGVLPPTQHLQHPDPACDLDYVPNVARRCPDIEYAMSNSFAFGGTNAVLICRRA